MHAYKHLVYSCILLHNRYYKAVPKIKIGRKTKRKQGKERKVKRKEKREKRKKVKQKTKKGEKKVYPVPC